VFALRLPPARSLPSLLLPLRSLALFPRVLLPRVPLEGRFGVRVAILFSLE
jgi:hypothetical protein